MRFKNRYLTAWLIAVVTVGNCQAADTHWIATWASSPLEGKIVIPGVPADKIPPSPILKGTVRYRLPLSQGGTRMILRITNETNKQPLNVGAVTVAIADAGLTSRAGTMRTVTFGGESTVTLPGGAPALSDPIDLPTQSPQALIVSIFLPDDTECPLGQRGIQAAIFNGRDATHSSSAEGASPSVARTLVSAILVSSGSAARTVVALGDSITDGAITDSPDVRGWPGHLALRLLAAGGPAHVAVANEGIGGNRLLNDSIGPNALARFDRDVLSLPSITHLVVLEGINDIGFSRLPDNSTPEPDIGAAALISAYRQIIARAHLHGIKVIGGTLLPFEGANYYSKGGDQTREAVNDWIRTSRQFDAVVDFDCALRDPVDVKKLAVGYDSGDHLHPSDAGYKAMANAFELKVFSGSK